MGLLKGSGGAKEKGFYVVAAHYDSSNTDAVWSWDGDKKDPGADSGASGVSLTPRRTHPGWMAVILVR